MHGIKYRAELYNHKFREIVITSHSTGLWWLSPGLCSGLLTNLPYRLSVGHAIPGRDAIRDPEHQLYGPMHYWLVVCLSQNERVQSSLGLPIHVLGGSKSAHVTTLESTWIV